MIISSSLATEQMQIIKWGPYVLTSPQNWVKPWGMRLTQFFGNKTNANSQLMYLQLTRSRNWVEQRGEKNTQFCDDADSAQARGECRVCRVVTSPFAGINVWGVQPDGSMPDFNFIASRMRQLHILQLEMVAATNCVHPHCFHHPSLSRLTKQGNHITPKKAWVSSHSPATMQNPREVYQ